MEKNEKKRLNLYHHENSGVVAQRGVCFTFIYSFVYLLTYSFLQGKQFSKCRSFFMSARKATERINKLFFPYKCKITMHTAKRVQR